MSQNNNQDSTIKTLGMVSLAVIVFALLYNSLLGGRTGFGFHMSYGYGPVVDVNGILASLLVLAVKLLWLVFIAALLAGTAVLIKKLLYENNIDLSFISKLSQAQAHVKCPSCGAGVSSEFKYCPSCRASLKDACSECGRDLLPGWKCCPVCGKEKKTSAPD